MVNKHQNLETRKEHYYLWSMVGLVLFSGLLVAITGYYISKYLLRKAENETNSKSRLMLLLASDTLWSGDEVQMQIADTYFNGKDYTKAAEYYGQVFSQQGTLGFAKAKYGEKDYQSVINLENKQVGLLLPETKLIIAQSFIKVGNISKARVALAMLPQTSEVIDSRLILLEPIQNQKFADSELSRLAGETNADNRRLIAYNALNSRGFPQAAFAILEEGYVKNELSRDGLLVLSQAQIERGQYTAADVALERALEKDAYYPQTYRQLIITSEKLGKDATKYKERLAAIAW